MSAKQKKIFDVLYFAYLIITSINLFLMTTTFKYGKYELVLKTIQFILQFTVIAKVSCEWRTKWSNKDIIVAIFTAGVFLLVACKYNYDDAFAYVFLILGAKDIDKKKILKVFLAVNVILFSITVGACLLGFIDNTITFRSAESDHARMALGFIYTTAVSAHFLTMVVCYVMIREKRISIIEIILIGISSGVIYYLTEARIGSFAIFLIFCGLIVARFCYAKNIELKIIRISFIKWAMIFASSILMFISVVMGGLYKYDSTFWSKINEVLSQRPLTNAITFHRYPISLIGKRILLHCNIFDGMDELPSYYYIINCSYINVLFSLGILGAFAILFIWTFLSYREAKNDNYLNLYILAVLAIFFFFEQRLFDFIYNPLLILLFARFSDNTVSKINDIKVLDRYKFGYLICRGVATSLVLAFVIECVCFNLGAISTFLYEGTTIDSAEVYSENFYMDTDYDMYGYTDSKPVIMLSDLKTYDDLESIFVEFHFMTKEDHYHYSLVENVKYDVDYYLHLEDGSNEHLGKITIDSSDRASGYIPVSIAGPTQNMVLRFTFPDDYYVYMAYLEFNGSKPFEIQYSRLLMLWIIISIVVTFIYKKEMKNVETLIDEEEHKEITEEGIYETES